MDESLSDFEEKKNFKNTQKSVKPSTSAVKPKKKPKRIRGQKDIRTALKGKKNELVAYSNDFDKLCKQSGIDVDPEQLQLAIALSKSLQESEKQEDNPNTQPLSSQDRVGKIRTTLLEYGFVVPDIKITAKKTKRGKKYKKDYKLLLTSVEEKQQVIADKYSQVLFQNLEKDTALKNNCIKNSSSLYYTATNISYEEIRNINLYYNKNLFEKLPNTVGTLLRNWSDIPGRPSSPEPDVEKLEFDKLYCTQEELDSVLSGSLKTAQNIAKDKYLLFIQDNNDICNSSENKCVNNSSKMDVECMDSEDTNIVKYKAIDLTEADDINSLTTTQNIRSCSPDLFEDDFSTSVEDSVHNIEPISEKVTAENSKVCSVVMDLTQCDNVHSQRLVEKPDSCKTSQSSQGYNVTKRKSNDLMEITDCVVGSSQPIRENIIEENIDLTQNSDDEGETTVVIDINSPDGKPVENMDLTQTSESSELPAVHLSGKDSLENTIILNEYTNLRNEDESASIKTQDNHKRIVASLSPIHPLSPKDKLIIDKHSITIGSEDEENYEIQKDTSNKKSCNPIEITNSDEQNLAHNTSKEQSLIENNKISKVDDLISPEKDSSKSKTESFFEEFNYHHSDSSSKEHSDNLCENKSTIYDVDTNEKENIDLTQNTDSSEASVLMDKPESPKPSLDTSNLGKIGNVSIDYDEMFDDMVRSHITSASQSNTNSLRSNTSDSKNVSQKKPSDSDINSSQNSEVFEISDKELDYSMHRSRLDIDNPRDNFDFGGISVVHNLPDLPSFRLSTSPSKSVSLKKSLSESYLPSVTLDRKSPSKSLTQTSSKANNRGMIAKTPRNGEYIIKTDEVTPMLDYEAMSTPEVNAELDKYGLKPFKRKRAIQLLTHLYNQTHPIVASCSEESMCSPHKKPKPNSSPTKRISPKKIADKFEIKASAKSPRKTIPKKNEEDFISEDISQVHLYEITNEVPVIRPIECADEDLVFQKKEKAKVQGCRVPLHIAFHNFVHSRARLRDAILRYEPVNIDVVHKGLRDHGFKYDPKDLLKFMDKKCITVKTADGTARTKKHY